jgi:hypothetical protein
LSFTELIRREWGAVTFILTVVVGLVIVPLGLYLGNRAPAPVSLPASSPTPIVTPAVTPSPSLGASPAPAPSPT